MKVIELLHRKLSAACADVHAIRLDALMAGVTSTITGQQLTVTALGRNLKAYSKTDTKHDIKRMDRLIGNPHLHAERTGFYRYMFTQLVGQQKHPVLMADWSPVPGNELFQLHRLSIPMGGRALTVYEQCFEEKLLNNTQVHNTFLDDVEVMLPEGCQPIILADAIYKTPWFEAIEAKGWYWVGRVRGNVQISVDGGPFAGCNTVMKQATGKATGLGEVLYSKKTKFPCQGVLYRGKAKGTHKKKKRGGVSKDTKSLYYARKAREAWLLISHLPDAYNTAKKVVNLYRKRMQIEEGFRDTKNQQYGLGLAQANSRSTQRYNNMLLIAALALFLLWCIGQTAVQQKYHHRLQANTIRYRTVLSNIYLAMQIINDQRYEIDLIYFRHVFEKINEFTQNIDPDD